MAKRIKGNMIIDEKVNETNLDDIKELLEKVLNNRERENDVTRKDDNFILLSTMIQNIEKNVSVRLDAMEKKIDNFSVVSKDTHDEVKLMNKLWLEASKNISDLENKIFDAEENHCTDEQKQENSEMRKEWKERKNKKEKNVKLLEDVKKNTILDTLKILVSSAVTLLLSIIIGSYCNNIKQGKLPHTP